MANSASYLNDKLLVVGAGGIGCELLKNLVLTGFTQIEVIDLDTIELSNLNRQFLFQKVHVGKPKALIARESVLKYNPNANIVAHHDSIMNVKYNVEYFKQFSIVLNALDNKAARSHVNRLCLAADIPLVESGSAGYLGQVTLIKKGLTECYDCLPKPPAKTFPGCTIRNTPSEPIHCIVWAKHLFNQLFGAEDPDEAVSPDGEDPENMAEAGKLATEKSENQEIVSRVSTRQWAKQTNYDPVKIFNKLFNDDIKYLLSMAKLWETRTPPRPLDWSTSLANTEPLQAQGGNTNSSSSESESQSSVSTSKPISHKIWSLSECCKYFSSSVSELSKRIELQRVEENEENPILAWDKDDEDAMNFVTAAANLRCFIFSIGPKSKFETKSLAGNIIPAIATTNAIVAGLIVLQALKVLNTKINECKTVYVRDKPSVQNKLIVESQLVKPNDKCYVCAPKPEIFVKLNVNAFTIKQFETKILKQELNMVLPDVEINDGTGRIIISSEEGETTENNDKTLNFFGLADQSSLKCDDFFQNYELRIILVHSEAINPVTNNGKDYEIVADQQLLKEISEKENGAQASNVVDQTPQNTAAAAAEEKKRTYDAAFEDDEPSSMSAGGVPRELPKKKRKSHENDMNGVPVIESANENGNGHAEDEDVVCSSDSINDASDALSDEDDDDDEPAVQPKNGIRRQADEDILVDDDILIDDSDESNESSGRNNDNGNSNAMQNGDSDDVIECSSEEEEEEEEIIEINESDECSKTTAAATANGSCSERLAIRTPTNTTNGGAGHQHQCDEDDDCVTVIE